MGGISVASGEGMGAAKMNGPAKKKLRRRLRNSLTPAEAVLWRCLQRRRLRGQKFRRQVSIGRYIVDFYCPEKKLVIELDGDAHFSPNADVYDDPRTEFLERQGLTVIRFENDELKENLDWVLERIGEYLK